MLGPVLAQELLLGSRRSRQHLFRWIYTGWLAAQLLFFYFLYLVNANVICSRIFGGADLTCWEIVVGKLRGRAAQVAVLALGALPLLCFIGIFGGLNLILVIALLAVSVAPMFALGAASLLASVWSRQTRDAVLGVY